MKPSIRVALLQGDPFWQNRSKNYAYWERKLASLTPESVDLVIFPEMFVTGFTMEAEKVAEEEEGETLHWVRQWASQLQAALVASWVVRQKGQFYHRLFWVFPEGSYCHYDKCHLFSMAGEDKVYTAGSHRLIVEYLGWRFAPFLCYDLRFPMFLRNLKQCYDVALFLANWPERRVHHWKLLLRARAVENHCYVLGVNRVGRDGRGITYSGGSAAIDPWGKVLWERDYHHAIGQVHLSRKVLSTLRDTFPVWQDEDDLPFLQQLRAKGQW